MFLLFGSLLSLSPREWPHIQLPRNDTGVQRPIRSTVSKRTAHGPDGFGCTVASLCIMSVRLPLAPTPSLRQLQHRRVCSRKQQRYVHSRGPTRNDHRLVHQNGHLPPLMHSVTRHCTSLQCHHTSAPRQHSRHLVPATTNITGQEHPSSLPIHYLQHLG